MLGGLARWLRAAGYDASWHPGIDDRDLVRLSQAQHRMLLSSDTGIFRIGLVRDGDIAALWIPHRTCIHEQLALVLRELRLPILDPRCMSCGGILAEVAKELVADKVPPRSFEWAEHFWQCQSCGQIFWHGTHWQKIEAALQQSSAAEC